MDICRLEWGVSADTENAAKIMDIIKDYPFIRHMQFKLPGEPLEAKRFSRLKGAAERARGAGLTISVHAYPHINLCETVTTLKQANLELADKALRACYDIGGVFAVFHGGCVQGRGNPDMLRRRALAALTDSMEKLLLLAEEYNIPVHLENIYPAPFRSELVRLPVRREDFIHICDMISGRLFGFCYDYGHGMIDSRTGDRPPIERISSFHLHENDHIGDLHLPIGIDGECAIDWPEEIKGLAERNFKGPIILENSSERLREALEAVSFIINYSSMAGGEEI